MQIQNAFFPVSAFHPVHPLHPVQRIWNHLLGETGDFRQDREDDQDWMQIQNAFFPVTAFHPVYSLYPVQRIWNLHSEIRGILDRIERINRMKCKYKMLFSPYACILSCLSSPSCPKNLESPFWRYGEF